MIDLVAEQSPLGGLQRWLADPDVTELLVNGGSDVWIERRGRLEEVGSMRPATVLGVLEHLLAPIGRRLDRAHPYVDSRLPDGSRLCAAIPPIAVDGPCLAIRRFTTVPLDLGCFADEPVASLLEEIVHRRCNTVISGSTSSGKTTLLDTLVRHLEPNSRVITMEDVAELQLRHPHVVRLETREASPDGVGEVSLAQLLRTALRMRPDRLVVGEIRGDEAIHLLQALNTGHDGSLCTIHANAPQDALDRLATLVLQDSTGWSLGAVHHHVARAVDVVVHLVRRDDGARRVGEIAEVLPPTLDAPTLAVRTLADGTGVVGALTRGRR
jgi:pilus assembly protein CpaF